MTRFICTADTHLGKGIGLYPERLAEQEDVWRQTLAAARSLEVAAVLHAGDLFDSRRPTPDVVLAAERPLVEHSAEDGCPVHVIAGNHDIPSQDGACGLDVLAEAGLIRLHRTPDVETFGGVKGREWCCVVMLPWTPPHRLLAASDNIDRGEVYAQASTLLMDAADELSVKIMSEGPPSAYRVLLGHWAVTGSSLPSGTAVAELNETILPLDRIQAHRWDAVVLGHIHRAQELGHADEPPIFYTGTPMSLDHGSPGAGGVWLLNVETGEKLLVPIASRPFVTLDRGIDDAIHASEIEGAVVRARLHVREGERIPDVSFVRESLLRGGAHAVTVVQVEVEHVERARPAAVAEDISPAAALEAWLENQGIDGRIAERALRRASAYLEGVEA